MTHYQLLLALKEHLKLELHLDLDNQLTVTLSWFDADHPDVEVTLCEDFVDLPKESQS